MENKIYNHLNDCLKSCYNFEEQNCPAFKLLFVEKKFGVFIFNINLYNDNIAYLLISGYHCQITTTVDYTKFIINMSSKNSNGEVIDNINDLLKFCSNYIEKYNMEQEKIELIKAYNFDEKTINFNNSIIPISFEKYKELVNILYKDSSDSSVENDTELSFQNLL